MSGWDIIEGDNPDFGLFGSRALNVAMLAALFIFFGVLLATLFGWLDRTLPRPSFRRRFGIVLLPSDLSLSGLAIQVTIGFGLFIATPVRRSHHRFRLCRRGRSQSGLLPDRSGLRSPGAPRGLRDVCSRTGRFQRLSDLRQRPAVMVTLIAVLAAPVMLGLFLDVRAMADIL